MWLWIAVAAVLVIAHLWARRASEIFCISVRAGRCLVVRGRISGMLQGELAELASRAPVRRGTIRAVESGPHARLVLSGIDDSTAQRMRNVFGDHPVQKLRTTPVAAGRNFGQWLGIAWLAWLLQPLDRRSK